MKVRKMLSFILAVCILLCSFSVIGNADFNKISAGDANLDGKVNSSDARIVLRIAAKLQKADATQKAICDMNVDGRINSSDARTVLQIAAKLLKFVAPELTETANYDNMNVRFYDVDIQQTADGTVHGDVYIAYTNNNSEASSFYSVFVVDVMQNDDSLDYYLYYDGATDEIKDGESALCRLEFETDSMEDIDIYIVAGNVLLAKSSWTAQDVAI